MSDSSDIEQRLNSILHDAAKILNLSDYTINLNFDAQRGDGFLGEFYKVSITNNDTKEEIHLAVKKAPEGKIQRENIDIAQCYKHEIRFYSLVYPELQKFEQEHQVRERFDWIPQYITSVGEIEKEMIVFKDITYEGFQMREKDLLLDDEHAGLIFKTYGHFHALSFCFKDQKPEEFEKLTQPFCSIWASASKKESFVKDYSDLIKQCYDTLDDDNDGPVKEKFRKYLDDPHEKFAEALNYYGDYSGLLHGDCWSNNIMFKYQNQANKANLESVNLIDFQLSIVGTPVFDLSYFLYVGGSKQLFDNLEHYLDLYYESFSKSVRNLGGNSEKLFPREALSQDWKDYSKFGMLVAFSITRLKLISKQDAIEIIEKMKVKDNGDYKIEFDQNLFKIRVQDIIRHMYEIDAL